MGWLPGSGCVLWLQMDEREGNTIYDHSGYQNHGTRYGASWRRGRIGYCLLFDGVDDYVDCGKDASLNPTSAITIEFWICIKGGAGTYRAVVTRWDTVAYVNERTYILEVGSDNKLHFRISRDGTDAGAVVISDPTAPSLTTWYHYIGTWDGTTMRLYRNGEQVATASQTAMKTSPNTRTGIGAVIGRSGDPIISHFNGFIDEVRIYNRALSAEEIKSHYHYGLAPSLRPPRRVRV